MVTTTAVTSRMITIQNDQQIQVRCLLLRRCDSSHESLGGAPSAVMVVQNRNRLGGRPVRESVERWWMERYGERRGEGGIAGGEGGGR